MTRRIAVLVAVAAVWVTACTRPADEVATTSSSEPIASTVPDVTAEVAPPTNLPMTAPPTESSVPPTEAPVPTDPAAPDTTAPAEPTAPEATAPPADCVAALPLAWRAGQVLMPAVYGDQLAAGNRLVDDVRVGGVILMTWPAGTDPAALQALKDRAEPPLLVSTDEEGGNVQRLRSLDELPSAADVAATMSPDQAEAAIAAHAAVVAGIGVDMVLAPVVDVGDAAPIGRRSFGTDPAVVTAYAAAYVRGWQSQGIIPVLKHFPGHGRASADTHTSSAATPPLAELQEYEFVPYRALAGSGAGVMVGHLDTPGLTDGDGLPASLSPTAIGYLRTELGFGDALVVTDGLGMGAVGAPVEEAAVLTLIAGSDIVLFTESASAGSVRDAIVVAVDAGRLPSARLDDAVGRILRHKGVDPCSLV